MRQNYLFEIVTIIIIIIVCVTFIKCSKFSTRDKVEVIKYEYNGHIYQRHYYNYYSSGTIHDPDCPKCLK